MVGREDFKESDDIEWNKKSEHARTERRKVEARIWLHYYSSIYIGKNNYAKFFKH